jgi:hypothetical protein
MFGRKPEPTIAAQSQARPMGMPVQILTPDFVIGGFLPPMDTPMLGFLNLPANASITLGRCRLAALNPQVVVPVEVAEITIPKANIIAVVPRDEAGSRSAMLNLPAASKRATLYAGPYLIQATIRVLSENAFSNFFSSGGGNLFTVTDATVRSTLPGAKFAELKVPALVVNRQLVQLYHAV